MICIIQNLQFFTGLPNSHTVCKRTSLTNSVFLDFELFSVVGNSGLYMLSHAFQDHRYTLAFFFCFLWLISKTNKETKKIIIKLELIIYR